MWGKKGNTKKKGTPRAIRPHIKENQQNQHVQCIVNNSETWESLSMEGSVRHDNMGWSVRND